MPRHLILAVMLALALVAAPALATSFIVPDDEELIAKANAIVIGTIDGSTVQNTALGIETFYDLRVSRTIKGLPHTLDTLRIVSPGGHLGDGGVIVHGAAHFEKGDRVLLFLTRDRGRWTPTDLTLGKFRFATSTSGTSVLVRDSEDVVGWDRAGRMHVERVRREAAFLRFVEERVAGRRPKADYFASTSELVVESASQEDAIQIQPMAPAFPAPTYTDHRPLNGAWTPTRWANMSAGASFWKRTSTNIPGAADGGVSVIQSAFASWNGECASNINLVYAGQRETASASQDGVSMVEFNDPQGRVAGSFGGSGTVGITFLSYWNPHVFAGTTWWSIRDADVVFQDGYTASNAGFPTAMMHEVGHGLGWRHSNAHYIRSTGNDEPCNPSISECSNAAIMYFTVIASYGYTLQTWDINAAQAVYPGGSCGAVTGFYVITPCRLIDTRNPNGPYGGPALGSGTARNIVVTGQCSIPSGATAVVINLAAVTPPSQGHMVAYPGPAGNAVPNVSNINFRPGETISNNAIVPIGPDGSINVHSTATSPTHIVIDVYGFFR